MIVRWLPKDQRLLLWLLLVCTLVIPTVKAQDTQAQQIKQLIEQLGSADPGEQWLAQQGLEQLGNPAILALISRLKDQDPKSTEARRLQLITELEQLNKNRRIRLSCVRILGDVVPTTPEIVEALIQAIADPDSHVAAEAVRIIGTITPATNEQKTMQALNSAIKADDWLVRAAAAEALGNIGIPAITVLITALEGDPHKSVRIAAIEALGKIQPTTKAITSSLIKALQTPGIAQEVLYTLGKIQPVSPETEHAVIRILKDRSQEGEIRRVAAIVLGEMSPLSPNAVDALIEVVSELDEDVAASAARTLGRITPRPEETKIVLALTTALQESDNYLVRIAAVEACRALGKPAITPLIDVLSQDPHGTVRLTAAQALRDIAQTSEKPDNRIMQAFIQVLAHDKDWHVRAQAVENLGTFRPASKDIVPPLTQALSDGHDKVKLIAAENIVNVALSLRDAGNVGAVDELNTALAALSAHNNTEVRFYTESMQRTVEHLELVLWNQILDDAKTWIKNNPWAPAYGVWVFVWLLIYWIHPITILTAATYLKPITEHLRLPSWLGSIKVPIEYVLIIGFLKFRLRVLDAWVARYIETARERFEQKPSVRDRAVHITMPVLIDGKFVAALSAEHLRNIFDLTQLRSLLIWGEGGSGKTSLACQIARWSMDEDRNKRIARHLMLPVLLEDEIEKKPEASAETAFSEAVGGGLKDLIGERIDISAELLKALLNRYRILVIVDRLSEMSETTRKVIQPAASDFPAGALVVTSRIHEPLGEIVRTEIKPLRVAYGDLLASFINAYLISKDKRDLFDEREFYGACLRISTTVGERETTVLLAKLFAEQMIDAKERGRLSELADTIPDLMLHYVNVLNRTVAKEIRLDDRTVRHIAESVAWQCLKRLYRTSPARIKDVLSAIDTQTPEHELNYIETRLRLVETVPPAEDYVRFLLHPLAEYLAGRYLVETYSDDLDKWQLFLKNLDQVPGDPQAIRGFLLAVLECCRAYGEDRNVPGFVIPELQRRTRLTKSLEKAI